jgi:hypothetical protein
MKIFSILFCLIIGAGEASATTTIKSSPDKPPEIILATANGSTSYTYPPSPPTGDLPVRTSWNLKDGAGNYSYVSLVENGLPDSLWTGWEEYDKFNADGTSSNQDWEDNYNVGLPPNRFLYSTDGFIFPGFPWEIGSLSETTTNSESLSRNSKITVQLRTGGKSGSKLQNLFGLQASATGYHHLQLDDDDISQPSDSYSISPTSIQVAGNSLDTNGNAYGIFPDNSTVDITPKTSEKYYSTSVSATKYKSHFTVFVDMPDPDGYLLVVDGDGGHSWWQLTTDAPSDAINKLISSDIASYIGQAVGYYPSNDLSWITGGSATGKLEDPESDSTVSVSKQFDIGFPDLKSGLNYTKQLHDSPGTYNVFFHNCVHATVGASDAANVGLPYYVFPEDLGNYLKGNF